MSGWRVPPVDLARENEHVVEYLRALLAPMLGRGEFILGDAVGAFEEEFARRSGATEAVGVSSGTDAIALALRGLGVESGDEVVTVANSFVATAGAIVQLGATPVFCDVGDDELIDVDQLEAHITRRTTAVVPVHLRGRPADLIGLRSVADRHGLAMVEDCSQAFLAERSGHQVGTVGHAGCFSLHPLKNPGAMGDAGVVITSDATLAARLRVLRNHGLVDRDTCAEWGSNARLDAVQAALLMPKLEVASQRRDRRATVAAEYRAVLEGLGDGSVVPPPVRAEAVEAWYSFVVRVRDSRDALLAALHQRGIGALVHYPVPIHLQPAARGLGLGLGALPTTERLAGEILTLPCFSTMTDDEVQMVADALLEVLPSA